MNEVTIRRRAPLRGASVEVPGDKSVTHRALLLGGFAHGETLIVNAGGGEDNLATVRALRAMGIDLGQDAAGSWRVRGSGMQPWRPPGEALDAGNSGTTVRLLAGLLAGMEIDATLDGDVSLRRRPMERVAAPLRDLGFDVRTGAGGCLPMSVHAQSPARGDEDLRVVLRVASAQVKSALLLASLRRGGVLEVVEPCATRDHTERLLRAMGVRCVSSQDYLQPGYRDSEQAPWLRLVPGGRLQGRRIEVPGDMSAAAFAWGVGLLGGAQVEVPGVGVNPGRVGLLEVWEEMGIGVNRREVRTLSSGEPAARVGVGGASGWRGAEVAGERVARLVDELPLLCVVAAACQGTFVLRDAAELRVKESDRIEATAALLRSLGVGVEESQDGLRFEGLGRARWPGFRYDARGDHRMAMAAAVAAVAAEDEVVVAGADAVSVSWPGFWEVLEILGLEVA